MVEVLDPSHELFGGMARVIAQGTGVHGHNPPQELLPGTVLFDAEQTNCITGLIALASGSCTASLALVVSEFIHVCIQLALGLSQVASPSMHLLPPLNITK